jgi:hypothetical protein
MAKERLSRLQKWILKTLYALEDGKSHVAVPIKILTAYARNGGGPEGKPFLNDHWPNRNTINATFSRSIRNMDEGFLSLGHKALVIRLSPAPPLDAKARQELAALNNKQSQISPPLLPTLDFQHATCLALTNKGREVARMLLNVKNPELNNKDR